MPSEGIIRPTVFEFFFQAAADFDLIFRSNRNVAAVEEAMEIAPKEEAVVHCMRSRLIEGLDVGGFEGGQRMLLRDRAGTVISIRDHDPEGPLAEARSDEHFFSISSLLIDPLLGNHITRQLSQPHLNPFPEGFPRFLGGRVVLSLLDRGLPIGRNRNPFRAVKKEWLCQEDAADREIVAAIRAFSTALCDQGPHLAEGLRSVLDVESLPGQADRKRCLLEEIPPADNIVERAVELEKERFSRLKDPEGLGASARLPEIHLVDSREARDDIEPIVVRDTDPEVSHHSCLKRPIRAGYTPTPAIKTLLFTVSS